MRRSIFCSCCRPSAAALSRYAPAFLAILSQTSPSQRKRSLRQEAASPALYGFNLAGLEALDASRQLYQRKEFAALRLSFLQTLFKTLLRRSHTLLQDEIIVTIHSIVSVDFDHFHQQFLFPFLTEATVLADPQKQALIDGFSTERDLPTFKTNVQARATTHPGTLLAARWRRFADTPAGLRRAGLRARLLLLRLPGRRGRVGAQLSGVGMGRPRAIQHGLGSSLFHTLEPAVLRSPHPSHVPAGQTAPLLTK